MLSTPSTAKQVQQVLAKDKTTMLATIVGGHDKVNNTDIDIDESPFQESGNPIVDERAEQIKAELQTLVALAKQGKLMDLSYFIIYYVLFFFIFQINFNFFCVCYCVFGKK